MKKVATIIAIILIACGLLAFFGYRNQVQEAAKATYESSYEHEVLDDIIKSSNEISQRADEESKELNDKISALEDFY